MRTKRNRRDGSKPLGAPETSVSESVSGMVSETVSEIEKLIRNLESEMQKFIDNEEQYVNLTSKERRRLIGSGVRNNGFIDKAFDIAHDNPEFMPPHFSIDALFEGECRFDELRQLTLVLQQFQQVATNVFMKQSDLCYRDALRIYGSLREQTKAKILGAEPLFQSLMNFFRRHRYTIDEPNEQELDQDYKQLVKE